jgi:hypothetical protein
MAVLAPTQARLSVSTPADPAGIPATASLAELEDIKAAWASQAAELGYLETCWQVVRWLGSPLQAQGWNGLRLWRSGDGELAIAGGEQSRKFEPEAGAWLVERKFNVWLRNPVETARNYELLRQAHGPLDAVIFSGRCVARGTWSFLDNENPAPQLQEGALFLPGRWFTKVLAVSSIAHSARLRSVADSGEAQRKALLTEMLVGQNI